MLFDINQYIFHKSFDKTISLYLVGDLHYGNVNCNLALFKDTLSKIMKDDNAYMIGMGDILESSIVGSPGLFDQDRFVNEQLSNIIDLLSPLANVGKLLFMIGGNHEDRIHRVTGLDLNWVLCKILHTEDAGVCRFLDLKVGNVNYSGYVVHGASGARFKDSKIKAEKRDCREFHVDFVGMGHMHQLIYDVEEGFSLENGKLVNDNRYYIVTGAYLEFWGSYANRKCYNTSGKLGSPIVHLSADHKRIEVEI